MIKEREINAIRSQSEAEGLLKGKMEVIKNLIEKMGLSDAQIADIIDVPINIIEKVRNNLKN